MNTKELGKLRMFIYKSGDEYVGVCLELNLIVREKTPKKAVKHIVEMSQGYLETVLKENLDDNFLNEKVSLKYRLIYFFGLLHKIITDFMSFEVPLIDGKYGVRFAV